MSRCLTCCAPSSTGSSYCKPENGNRDIDPTSFLLPWDASSPHLPVCTLPDHTRTCSHFPGAAGLQHNSRNTSPLSDGRCNRNVIYYCIFLAAFLDLPRSRWRMSSTNREAVGVIIHTCLILLEQQSLHSAWKSVPATGSQSPSLTQQPRRP